MEMDNYQLEEIARTYLGMGIQHWGQTAEQRENATREYVGAAGLKFGSAEANEWLKSVILNLRRGKFETEVEQLIAALASRQVTSEIEALRTALKPFAWIAEEYARVHEKRVKVMADEGLPAGKPLADEHRVSIALGDCRKAAAALQQPKPDDS